jgi:S-DNA-T family DNA segregation ATPase FtsK/SpoIIIE
VTELDFPAVGGRRGDGGISLPRPPTEGGGRTLSWLQVVVPLLGGAGALAFFVIAPSPVYLLLGMILALSAVGGGIGYPLMQRAEGRRRSEAERRRFFDRLGRARSALVAQARTEWQDANRRHPLGRMLLSEVLLGRCWSRRTGSVDYLSVAVGRGPVPMRAAVSVPFGEDENVGFDEVCLTAIGNLIRRHRYVHDCPLPVVLDEQRAVVVHGPPAAVQGLARSLVAQLAVHHPPADLRLAVIAPGNVDRWEWTKWLPAITWRDDTGTEQAVYDRSWPAGSQMATELARRASSGAGTQPFDVVIVLDETTSSGASALGELLSRRGPGVHLLALRGPDPGPLPAGAAEVVLRGGPVFGIEVRQGAESPVVGQADQLGPTEAEAVARALAPLRFGGGLAERKPRGVAGLSDLLGLDVVDLNPALTWSRREGGLLAAPVGLDAGGQPLVLDLKESALGGMGPHGLVVGATGSGKSELLRTFVTCLALTHPPDVVSFVLIDFKGGATFAGMEALPHVAGSITNLADDPTLVDRMEAALAGEQRRRQRILRDAGNVPSLAAYRERAADTGAEPLPYLVVVIDEFSELLTARPEVIDLLVSIGRLGRSLGMHLMLASQRLEEGRLRGLESHLSYRVALRTFSAAESRAVLGTTDAYELPGEPGWAILKVDTSVYERFRAGLVSSPVVKAAPPPAAQGRRRAQLFDLGERHDAPALEAVADEVDRSRTVVDLVVERLAAAAPPAHRIWLEPLPPRVDLGRFLPAGGEPPRSVLRVPVGLLDRPQDQIQEPFELDLSGAGGNLALVGAPRTGKTVFLRTLVLSLAKTHTPEAVQCYVIDLGGGGLGDLEGLPHVGGVASRLDPDRVRRTVHQVAGLLRRREALFAANGIDSVERFRAMRAGRRLPPEALGDVFLIVDNYGALRSEFEDLDPVVEAIALGGLAFGIHVVLTAGRWLDLKARVRDAIGSRLELRLNDPSDSDMGRRLAEAVRQDTPGRGLSRAGLQFQLALPRVDGSTGTDDLAEAFAAAAASIASSWSGPWAPPVRLLPARIELSALPAATGFRHLRLGLAEESMEVVGWDLSAGDAHLVAIGDSGAGKSSLARTVLAEIARHPLHEVRALVVDPRRGLQGVIPDGDLLAYAPSAPAAEAALKDLATLLGRRLPAADLTPEVLRDRSWWSGPEVVVVVDDYDMLAGSGASPLAPLLALLPHAPDIGLHVFLTRRVTGYSRALFEPVLQRIRELGNATLVLSGSPDEGPVAGPVRARPMPPGRGYLVSTRLDVELVQVALADGAA